MYGYNSGESTPRLQFGLNQKVKLEKFVFNPNAGKDNSPADALDIVFVNEAGAEISYRQFPVTKAYDNGVEITDPNHAAMKKEFRNFNAKISQIMECFLTVEEIKEAVKDARDFKSFCNLLSAALPTDAHEKELDVFGQYQWQPREEGGTKYTEIPKKVSMGKVFVPHVEGNFTQVTVTDEGVLTLGEEKFTGDEDGKEFVFDINGKSLRLSNSTAIAFIDLSGEEVVVHPFRRNHWFADSNWAKKSNDEVADDVTSDWD